VDGLGIVEQRVEARPAEHADLGLAHEEEASFFDPEPELDPEPDDVVPSEDPDEPELSEPEEEPPPPVPEPLFASAVCFSDPDGLDAERLSVA
jgi:hypothetical protein